jgi:ribosomal protein S17
MNGSKFFEGMVVRKAHQNPDTLKVATRIPVTDKKYKKRSWISKYIMVHDPECCAQVGDVVLFKETRPISATKNHILERVTTSGKS